MNIFCLHDARPFAICRQSRVEAAQNYHAGRPLQLKRQRFNLPNYQVVSIIRCCDISATLHQITFAVTRHTAFPPEGGHLRCDVRIGPNRAPWPQYYEGPSRSITDVRARLATGLKLADRGHKRSDQIEEHA